MKGTASISFTEAFSEKDAGIDEFVSSHQGFFGIIKQRFSDFHVNEITAADEIVHLTNMDIPPAPVHNDKPCSGDVKQPSAVTSQMFTSLEVLSGKKSILEVKPKVTLSNSGDNMLNCEHIKNPTDVKINVDNLEKQERKEVHNYLKTKFPDLASTTIDIESSKFICVVRKDNSKSSRRDRPNRPKSKTYTTFVLYKENIDTASCINLIAGKLRMKSSSFGYAGMKDKRAKTSQLVSCFQVPSENISNACRHIRGVRVGNFTYLPTPQKLGQLKGNYFTIVLREVAGMDDEISKSLTSLSTLGFLNYYGLQRFGVGSGCAATHRIGKAILTSNWKEALDLIMLGRSHDAKDMAEARRVWKETRDAAQAMKQLKPYNRNSIEGCLLAALARQGDLNIVNALDMVPRNTRLLYIHAYQSYIWNSVVSRRVRTYGLKVIPGDLIKLKTKAKLNISSENSSNDGEQDDSEPVYALMEGDLDKVNITDVVLPLPGHKVMYPKNDIENWYVELMQKDGLSSKLLQHKIKTYSLTGAYRRMLVIPENLEYKIGYYDDPLKPLVVSDCEKLDGIDHSVNKLKTGKCKSVIVSLSLPTSAYATMALRELLKMGTSSHYHTSLNAVVQTSEVKNTESIGTKRKSDVLEKDNIEKDGGNKILKRSNNEADTSRFDSVNESREMVEEDVGGDISEMECDNNKVLEKSIDKADTFKDESVNDPSKLFEEDVGGDISEMECDNNKVLERSIDKADTFKDESVNEPSKLLEENVGDDIKNDNGDKILEISEEINTS